MGNRSLDDFLGGDSEATADEPEESVDESGESADGSEAAAAEQTDDAASDTIEESSAVDDESDEPNATDGETGAADEEVNPTAEESSEGDEPPVAAATVEPAVSTYTWSGDGGVCETCGETVDRRWRQDDALVCPECKEW